MSDFKDVLMCIFWYRERIHGWLRGVLCIFVYVRVSSHICGRVYMQCQLFLMCVKLYVLIKYIMQPALLRGKCIWDSSNAHTLLSHAKDQTDTVKFSFH